MNYTVLWKPSASARLADIWIDAPDRAAVRRAADRIDAILQRNPSGVGEARGDEQRILIAIPLAIVYAVRDADRCVDVLTVRHVPVRRNPN